MQLPRVPSLKESILYQGRQEPVYSKGLQVRTEAKAFVSRAGYLAPLRLRSQGSVGHEWGYMGTGPTRLAFDILMDFFEDQIFAFRYLTEFNDVLSRRTPHQGEWDLPGSEILKMIEDINQSKGWAPLDPDSEEYRRLQAMHS